MVSRRVVHLWAVVLLATTGILIGATSQVARAATGSCSTDSGTGITTCSYTAQIGTLTTFSLPNGITTFDVTAVGAGGGAIGVFAGGSGASVSSTVTVQGASAATDFAIAVGTKGAGTFACGSAAGGQSDDPNRDGGAGQCKAAGGGGASGIYLGSTFSTPIVIAGGGGGTNAGSGNSGGTGADPSANGGSSGPNGGNGGTSDLSPSPCVCGGRGGTPSTPGAGGGSGADQGSAGTASGLGGDGSASNGGGQEGGGGGGGGYTGGGGGGETTSYTDGGGGGAGASYAVPSVVSGGLTVTTSNTTYSQATGDTDGSVTITYKSSSPTRALIASTSVEQRGQWALVSWRAPHPTGVAGFLVRQSGRTLTPHLVAVHRSPEYRVRVRVRGAGPIRVVAVWSTGGAPNTGR